LGRGRAGVWGMRWPGLGDSNGREQSATPVGTGGRLGAGGPFAGVPPAGERAAAGDSSRTGPGERASRGARTGEDPALTHCPASKSPPCWVSSGNGWARGPCRAPSPLRLREGTQAGRCCAVSSGCALRGRRPRSLGSAPAGGGSAAWWPRTAGTDRGRAAGCAARRARGEGTSVRELEAKRGTRGQRRGWCFSAEGRRCAERRRWPSGGGRELRR
jgi:hypothetical protein